MEYRKFYKLGIKTSLIGFGCMRFPHKKGAGVNEKRAHDLIDTAYQNGINYFDTAYNYHDGESERIVGEALAKYERSTYYIASKLPCWMVNSIEDAQRIFDEQLVRLQKDYIDFYLLHALNQSTFNEMVKLGIIEFCERLKDEGKIKYFGFSFHDDYKTFEYIIKFHEWDFCQIQYNYMDRNIQAGDAGYKLAEKLGVPLVIMEPLKGGILSRLPKPVTEIFTNADHDCSVASWGLRWVASHENVKVVLSGMSDDKQVIDNLKTFDNFCVLSPQENQVVESAVELLKSRMNNGCSGCQYCMPCAAGVDIPLNFRIWNDYGLYRLKPETQWFWNNDIKEEAKAKNCIGCGECEAICPQHIDIRRDLKKLQTQLDRIK